MTLGASERFGRFGLLVGGEGVARLARAKVAVFGLGGVGSYAVEALARAGIGRLVLVDHDTVEPSNLNRQLFALESTLGRPKVDIAAQRIADINPDADVDARQVRVKAEGEAELQEQARSQMKSGNEREGRQALAGGESSSPRIYGVSISREGALEGTAPLADLLTPDTDYIVDAIDDLDAKVALIAWAHTAGLPLVSCMGAARRLRPTGVTVADIADTHTCPLARTVRQRLRARDIRSGVRCVYCTEPPLPPAIGQARAPLGSTSYLPGILGLTAAGVVIDELLRS